MSGIFRAYDIRGAYPDELNEEITGKIGSAFVDCMSSNGFGHFC